MKKIVGVLACLLLLCACAYEANNTRIRLEVEAVKEQERQLQLELEAKAAKEEEERLKNQIDPDKPMVALTFDDGPGRHTERLLALLEKYHAKATFFMVGENISKYPDAIKKMKELGCELGNHTYTHQDLTKLEPKQIKTQINKTDKELKKIIGEKSTLIRPPYGAVNKTLRQTADRPLIFWSMDTLDWQYKDSKRTIRYVMKKVEDGEIILLHDIHEATVDAMEKLIPKLIDKGYQLVTVSELAQARESTMKKGNKYFDFYKK